MPLFVVSGRLKPSAAPKALALLGDGLAVDLEANSFEQHFGGRLEELIEGELTLHREPFGRQLPPAVEGVTFGPEPGPGDSEGG
jgi:hypothetical protein